MNEKAPAFELTPAPVGLLTVAQAAEAFGISRQAFHRWNVRPERVQGREKLFTLAAIVANRLEHAAADSPSPDEAELDRLEARRELLSEQLEAQALRNEAARSASTRRTVAGWVLQHLMHAAGQRIEALPDDIIAACPKTKPARALIEAEARAAADLLRRASLPDPDPDGHPQVYT